MDILFKTSSLRLLFTLYNSYGFKESLLTWAKIKFFFRLYENVVLKNKNVLNKCNFPQVLRLHIQNPKSYSWKVKSCVVQNHWWALHKITGFLSNVSFFQHSCFVHIFNIKLNKYVRSCKRKIDSILALQWVNWIMGGVLAIIWKLSFNLSS